jgi:hypothetical protein
MQQPLEVRGRASLRTLSKQVLSSVPRATVGQFAMGRYWRKVAQSHGDYMLNTTIPPNLQVECSCHGFELSRSLFKTVNASVLPAAMARQQGWQL